MITRTNTAKLFRIPLLAVLMLACVGCWETAMTKANFLGGLYLADSSQQTAQTLNVIDYSKQSGSALPSDTSALASVTGNTATGIILLTFTGLLQGSSVETIIPNDVTKMVAGFTPQPGLVEIWSGTTAFTNFTTSYRPDGGYIPTMSTPADQFPKPAISVALTAALPAGIIVVYLIAGKVARADGTVLPALKDKDGNDVKSPSGALVAGTVWFQTK